jgi:hypothetical protein
MTGNLVLGYSEPSLLPLTSFPTRFDLHSAIVREMSLLHIP